MFELLCRNHDENIRRAIRRKKHMNRTKNATRNIFFGTVLKLYQIIVPFLMRTAMIYLLGVEYLGLSSLFTSILQVLNLAELGVGSAMVYSMYKPIADKDEETVCALLKLYKKYYFLIGLVIAVGGISLTPAIPKLISGDIPEGLNVYLLYLFNLAATVMTYWLFAYKNSLLQVHQRNDVSSKVTILTTTVQYSLQLFVLWAFQDYYLYVLVMLATQVITNVVTAIVVSKMYPQYSPKGELSRVTVNTINQRIKDLFTAKLGATVVNSADTVVISAFLGLTVLAMYQNYYFIMSAVMGLLTIVFSSCLAGVGNSMITESLDKNYNDFRVITFLMNWIITVCMCCFATMYQPFIELWVGYEYTFDMTAVALFCVYFYLVIIQQIIGMYKDAAGIWHQDRFRPLVASLVNLISNLFLVRWWGISAIIASTIISYIVVAMPWMINNVFKHVFKRDWKKYTAELIIYFVVACVISVACYFACDWTEGFGLAVQVVLNALICVTLSNIILIIVYRKNQYYNQMIDLANRATKNKISCLLNKFRY